MKADGETAVSVAAEQGKVDTLLLPVIRITKDGVSRSTEPTPVLEFPDKFDEFELAVRKSISQGANVLPVIQDSFADDPTMKALLRFN